MKFPFVAWGQKKKSKAETWGHVREKLWLPERMCARGSFGSLQWHHVSVLFRGRRRESPPLIQQHIQMHIDSAVHQLSLLRLPSLFTSGNHDTHQQTRHQSQVPDPWSTWWHRPKTKIYPRKESQAKHTHSGGVDKSRRKFAYSPDPGLPVCLSAVSSLVLHFPEPAFP